MKFITHTELKEANERELASETVMGCVERLRKRGLIGMVSSKPRWAQRAIELDRAESIKEAAIKRYIESIPILERWDYVEPINDGVFAVKLRSHGQSEQLVHFAKQGVKVRLK